ncbi:MAG: CotS family spore coat protein [Sarcina sp.]
MIRVKYNDAKYLCKYDLDIEFFEQMNLNINDLWPARNIFVLDTQEGKKILKLISYKEDKLLFIVDILKYLKKTYKEVLNINKFDDEKYFIEKNGNKYILLNLIEGIECNLNNPLDLEAATKSIANLHKAGYGSYDEFKKKYKNKLSLGNLLEKFKEGKDTLIECKKLAQVKLYKNEFDEIFLSNVDENIKNIELAIKMLENSNYKKMCENKDYITICHNDLAYHNMIITNGNVSFIDFDYANIDLRILDVFNFAIKTLKRYAFDYDIYANIIENYNSISELTNEELELFKILLVYPSDFLTISKNYYYALKDWRFESYLNKLENKILYKKEKENLIGKL